VLPIGGVKEKTIAAARAGIKKVILPARNRRDLDDIPQSTRALLEFVWVERVQEALEVALGEPAGSIDKVGATLAAAKSSNNGQAQAAKSAA
jgi:ATP-dependent Lon protease